MLFEIFQSAHFALDFDSSNLRASVMIVHNPQLYSQELMPLQKNVCASNTRSLHDLRYTCPDPGGGGGGGGDSGHPPPLENHKFYRFL